jgi:hypothetical protein
MENKEYNFIKFTPIYRVGYEPRPYISLCSNGLLRFSNSLQETKQFKVNDKIIIYYEKYFNLLKLEKSNIGREIKNSFIIPVYELETIIPKGRYFQTENKDIFKLEEPTSFAEKLSTGNH